MVSEIRNEEVAHASKVYPSPAIDSADVLTNEVVASDEQSRKSSIDQRDSSYPRNYRED